MCEIHDPVLCFHPTLTPPLEAVKGDVDCASLYYTLHPAGLGCVDYIDRILGRKEYSPLRCYFVMVSNKLDRIKDKTATFCNNKVVRPLMQGVQSLFGTGGTKKVSG